MLAPPLLWARSKTRLLSLFILNVFTLFVVTILKLIVSADFLSLVCPKCLTIRTNTVLQLFQEHKIVCNLRDSIRSCVTYGTYHIFFGFKSLSRRSGNDRISASMIQTFSPFPRQGQTEEDIIVH